MASTAIRQTIDKYKALFDRVKEMFGEDVVVVDSSTVTELT